MLPKEVNTLFPFEGLDSPPMEIDLGARLLEKIEAWRERQKINKVEMADLLKLNSKQAYSNWVSRGTVPKDHLETAMTIVTCDDLDEAKWYLRGNRPRRALQHLADAINEDPQTTQTVRRGSEALQEFDQVEMLARQLNPKDQRAAIELFVKQLPPSEQLEFAISVLSDLQPELSSK